MDRNNSKEDRYVEKIDRVMLIYLRLLRGEVLKKKVLASEFNVTERSIQRDLGALRCFLAEQTVDQDIVYDPSCHGYRLENGSIHTLSNSEILAVCKILLESRSMCRKEMLPILHKLIECCVPEKNRHIIEELVANEEYHYIEPHHGKPLLDKIWDLGQAIREHRIVEMEYTRLKEPSQITRRVLPVGLMFSEYYYYLTAFLESRYDPDASELLPTIYRVDRISSLRILDEHFRVPYKNRFEEGEFRKRVQFMYGGKLEKIRFRYTGPSLEAVLDRLPTAKVLEEVEDGWIVEAEVYGRGGQIWVRSQGDYVELL